MIVVCNGSLKMGMNDKQLKDAQKIVKQTNKHNKKFEACVGEWR